MSTTDLTIRVDAIAAALAAQGIKVMTTAHAAPHVAPPLIVSDTSVVSVAASVAEADGWTLWGILRLVIGFVVLAVVYWAVMKYMGRNAKNTAKPAAALPAALNAPVAPAVAPARPPSMTRNAPVHAPHPAASQAPQPESLVAMLARQRQSKKESSRPARPTPAVTRPVASVGEDEIKAVALAAQAEKASRDANAAVAAAKKAKDLVRKAALAKKAAMAAATAAAMAAESSDSSSDDDSVRIEVLDDEQDAQLMD